jgi:hypothetical protein
VSIYVEANMNAKRWLAGFVLVASLGGCVVTPVGYRYNDGYDGYHRYHGSDYRDRWGYRSDYRDGWGYRDGGTIVTAGDYRDGYHRDQH